MNGHTHSVDSHINENGLNGEIRNSFKSEYLNINACINREFTYDAIKKIADWLLERISIKPKIAIVCGSGLGGIAERLEQPQVIPYNKVPNFPQSTGEC
jgi:purine-nucleoside phosphorylase